MSNLPPLSVPVVFYPGNDQSYTFGPVVRGSTAGSPSPTYLSDCTGTATLKDPAGRPVPGLTNLSFTFVGGSNGLYQLAISGASFNPPIGSNYWLNITLNSAAYGLGVWNLPTLIEDREA